MATYFTSVSSEQGVNRLDENPCLLIDFARLMLSDSKAHSGHTGEREVLLVLFGGRCTIEVGGKAFEKVGKRPNPLSGKPHAVYLPANTAYTITAHGNLDAGLCSAPSDLGTEPYAIQPEQVTANQMGAASFSRELLNILTGSDQPDLPARRLIVGLTKALANEWAKHGINVNAIAPGYMVTDNTEALRSDPERNRQIMERIPTGRWGTPEELASAVVFLASRASDYVNGHILAVDGGWLTR